MPKRHTRLITYMRNEIGMRSCMFCVARTSADRYEIHDLRRGINLIWFLLGTPS